MLIYYYDENNTYTHSDLIGDDAVMPANATKVAPLDGNGAGLYEPIIWNPETQTWTGATKEEYDAAHPADPGTNIQQPTADQTAQAQQMLTLAKLTNQVTLLQSTVATLMLQNAANKEEKQNV
ncbi:hypothetical protein DXD09_06070 [Ligilactobacillus ruminis]|uniref:Uncharacterized protein n=1 Tax=Ligilactobacillus ruminis TaxID=1623 RepID=A0A8B2Z267_9LACO|nr:hypothetical protein [Ligilactobacillus ruminis]RGK46559.1 hypothetical protein DXD09_06070 [Ligilactobacillus ruminis]